MTRCLGCMAEYKSEYGMCPHCGYEPGTVAESSLHMRPGSTLAGRYLIGKVIGYDGFGVTYIGWDNTLQQRVAIKEYLPSEFATRAVGQTQVTVFGGNKAQLFVRGVTDFMEDAQELIRFKDQPGISGVFDVFRANNTAYIVMEYFDGETLANYLSREGKIPVKKAIEMLNPVISSLGVAHKAGIVHHNITPYNIVFAKDGSLKLLALARNKRGRLAIPGFSPPELYDMRKNADHRADIYAFGAVIYWAITGKKPDESINRMIEDLLIPPITLDSHVPAHISKAIMQAMALDPKKRYLSCSYFLQALMDPKHSIARSKLKNLFSGRERPLLMRETSEISEKQICATKCEDHHFYNAPLCTECPVCKDKQHSYEVGGISMPTPRKQEMGQSNSHTIKKKRCENGHFFDAGRFMKCPVCGALATSDTKEMGDLVIKRTKDTSEEIDENLALISKAHALLNELEQIISAIREDSSVLVTKENNEVANRLSYEISMRIHDIRWRIESLQEFYQDLQCASMECVYASPAVMSCIDAQESIFNDEQVAYPYLHANQIQDRERFEGSRMGEIYGSPKMIREHTESLAKKRISVKDVRFCIYCGQKVDGSSTICNQCGKLIDVDLEGDSTAQICRSCAEVIPIISKFCPYCGAKLG